MFIIIIYLLLVNLEKKTHPAVIERHRIKHTYIPKLVFINRFYIDWKYKRDESQNFVLLYTFKNIFKYKYIYENINIWYAQ